MIVNKKLMAKMSMADLDAMRRYISLKLDAFEEQYGENQIEGALQELDYSMKDKFKELFEMTEI